MLVEHNIISSTYLKTNKQKFYNPENFFRTSSSISTEFACMSQSMMFELKTKHRSWTIGGEKIMDIQ